MYCATRLYRISAISSRGYYLFQLHGSAAPIRGRRLFGGGVYSARRAGLPPSLAPSAHVNFVFGLSAHTCTRDGSQFSFLLLSQSRAIAVTVLSHVGNVIDRDRLGSSRLHMRIATVHMKCGYCSRAATVTLSPRSLRRLIEGGVYSGCGVY